MYYCQTIKVLSKWQNYYENKKFILFLTILWFYKQLSTIFSWARSNNMIQLGIRWNILLYNMNVFFPVWYYYYYYYLHDKCLKLCWYTNTYNSWVVIWRLKILSSLFFTKFNFFNFIFIIINIYINILYNYMYSVPKRNMIWIWRKRVKICNTTTS